MSSSDSLDYIAEDLREQAVSVDSVEQDPANVREHPEKNKQAVKRSLREFGQRQVLVAREEQRTIIAGNLRLEVARELGWSHVAVIFVADDDLEAARYAIADNRTTDLGEWSDEGLSDMLAALDNPPPGFDEEDVGELLADMEPIDERDDFSGLNEEVDVDDLMDEPTECPRCGFEFEDGG